jgi:hypothetical protein
MKTNDIKTYLVAVLMKGLLYAPLASAGESNMTPTDRITLFKVPLQCPAAPQIGCGGASKPILLQLEREPGVLEAWLNRAGTRIAVVWKPESNADTRRNVAAELKEDHATELDGKSRDEALKGFLSGKGWYRGADVDRLSEEEAAIIAARLVRWVQAKRPLAKDKNHLEDAADIARQYLDQEQIKILNEAIKDEAAIENGERPAPNEN